MLDISNGMRRFLFAPQSSIWLATLRIGLGLQVLFYGISLHGDWLEVLGRENQGLIRRDLAEAMLSAESPLIPRIGWIVDAGAYLGLSESTLLWSVWAVLMLAALLFVVGLFCRTASVVTWLLYVCTAKSAELLSYGLDNFTIIGLFYLAIAPLPDAYSLDARWRGLVLRCGSVHGLHRRVLQLHMCIIYFFGGIAKCAGAGWWNGESIWRAMIRPPFNIISPNTVIHWESVLPIASISVLVLETAYPVFIWPKRTRAIWLFSVVIMHIAIGLLMGMYLFALVMITLNLAAFGLPFRWRPSAAADALAEEGDA